LARAVDDHGADPKEDREEAVKKGDGIGDDEVGGVVVVDIYWFGNGSGGYCSWWIWKSLAGGRRWRKARILGDGELRLTAYQGL
jgi:hypothetical protein